MYKRQILQAAIDLLEENSGGFASATENELRAAIEAASNGVGARWEQTVPIPPPVIWRRKLEEVAELALAALSITEPPLTGQRLSLIHI